MVVSLNLLMHLKTMYHHLKMSAQEGALVEPTAAVQAVKEGNLLFGDTVAILVQVQLVY